jgi:uncharacterized protein
MRLPPANEPPDMAEDLLGYDKLIETALRGVVRAALRRAAGEGLPGTHHFYVGFRTAAAGACLPGYLAAKFPEEMTIVLQHQFWGLEVGEDAFSVTLSFQGRSERLTIPFAALTSFADPAVGFRLNFEVSVAAPPEVIGALPATTSANEAAVQRPAAEVVALDQFRKR